MNLVDFHELFMLGTKIISENIEKLVFSKNKIKFWAIRAVIVSMQIKYNDPGSNLSLQTFVHKIIQFYFFVVMIFDVFSCFPDSFWWISTDLSTK